LAELRSSLGTLAQSLLEGELQLREAMTRAFELATEAVLQSPGGRHDPTIAYIVATLAQLTVLRHRDYRFDFDYENVMEAWQTVVIEGDDPYSGQLKEVRMAASGGCGCASLIGVGLALVLLGSRA
jgi:hypothetical protein